MDCLFCKIINKEVSSDIIYEDDKFLAFKDINPKAPIHFLIIPKKHITSINHLQEEDKMLIGELIFLAKKIAEEKNLDGYQLHINVGRNGGQIIDHLHLHLLANK
ncbi:MAG TPA: histidine triad nucleotide-binding protein [Candidatus Pacearchaeota archaeon]|nr:histidine triad nucleotide-binding protein [Candidatus Paceibacterota bacterium]HOK00395.1 histidine triad nucleotide-binding protein [Candidatus Pacearchaeota archaeon]HOL90176.1 histidine triad nucleotide-binding protein [Candidatus Pacearchaeota archaeon]HPO68277.1 histidine triad nucleotide-binding protein [Candidatus Pacearchaeota archaeon]